jgi:hypothetical protein
LQQKDDRPQFQKEPFGSLAQKQVVLWDLPGVPSSGMEAAKVFGHLLPATMGVSVAG